MGVWNKKFTIFVDVDDSAVLAKLNKVKLKFKPALVDETIKVARAGRDYAKAEAPFRTGETSRLIISAIQYQSNNKISAFIGYKQIPHPNKKWRGQQFVLPYWLTYSSLAKNYNYSGRNPRYMIITQRYIREKFPKRIRFRVRDVLKES